MKLLIVTQVVDDRDPVLGFFVGWIRAFAAKCERVVVIARRVGPHDLPANVAVHSMGGELGAGKLAMLWNYWLRLAKELPRTDAVFVHMAAEFVLYSLPVTVWSRKPLVLWYAHKKVGLALRLASRLVTAMATASDESLRIDSKRKRVVGHGIRIPSAPRVASRSLRLLSVGRLSPVKNHELAIRALAEIRRSRPDAYLSVVGAAALESDRAYEAKLRGLVAKLGIAEAVDFAGGAPHAAMPEIYARHDLLIHASETGSFDKVVAEALVAGLGALTSSEAFPDLPEAMRFPKGDLPALVRKIGEWDARIRSGRDDFAALRAEWRARHDLDGLVRRILALTGLVV